jgi:hypothetical protein
MISRRDEPVSLSITHVQHHSRPDSRPCWTGSCHHRQNMPAEWQGTFIGGMAIRDRLKRHAVEPHIDNDVITQVWNSRHDQPATAKGVARRSGVMSPSVRGHCLACGIIGAKKQAHRRHNEHLAAAMAACFHNLLCFGVHVSVSRQSTSVPRDCDFRWMLETPPISLMRSPATVATAATTEMPSGRADSRRNPDRALA